MPNRSPDPRISHIILALSDDTLFHHHHISIHPQPLTWSINPP
jgi:hypothetical protein